MHNPEKLISGICKGELKKKKRIITKSVFFLKKNYYERIGKLKVKSWECWKLRIKGRNVENSFKFNIQAIC